MDDEILYSAILCVHEDYRRRITPHADYAEDQSLRFLCRPIHVVDTLQLVPKAFEQKRQRASVTSEQRGGDHVEPAGEEGHSTAANKHAFLAASGEQTHDRGEGSEKDREAEESSSGEEISESGEASSRDEMGSPQKKGSKKSGAAPGSQAATALMTVPRATSKRSVVSVMSSSGDRKNALETSVLMLAVELARDAARTCDPANNINAPAAGSTDSIAMLLFSGASQWGP